MSNEELSPQEKIDATEARREFLGITGPSKDVAPDIDFDAVREIEKIILGRKTAQSASGNSVGAR